MEKNNQTLEEALEEAGIEPHHAAQKLLSEAEKTRDLSYEEILLIRDSAPEILAHASALVRASANSEDSDEKLPDAKEKRAIVKEQIILAAGTAEMRGIEFPLPEDFITPEDKKALEVRAAALERSLEALSHQDGAPGSRALIGSWIGGILGLAVAFVAVKFGLDPDLTTAAGGQIASEVLVGGGFVSAAVGATVGITKFGSGFREKKEAMLEEKRMLETRITTLQKFLKATELDIPTPDITGDYLTEEIEALGSDTKKPLLLAEIPSPLPESSGMAIAVAGRPAAPLIASAQDL